MNWFVIHQYDDGSCDLIGPFNSSESAWEWCKETFEDQFEAQNLEVCTAIKPF
jgi:hypothetical protein